jgi:chromosome segregation protein
LQSDLEGFLSLLCTDQTTLSTASIETLMKTTLIRDEFIVALSVDLPEQARFTAVRAAMGGLIGPDHSERTGAILRAANFARDEQNTKVKEAQSELGRTLTAVTEARSTAERSSDISEALRIIDESSLSLPVDPRERMEALRRLVAERRQALQRIEAARSQSEAILPELRYFRSEAAERDMAAARANLQHATQATERAQQTLALAQRADTAERESDSHAGHLAALIEHGGELGLQDGHCPLCAAYRSAAEFDKALATARARLAERGERLLASSRAIRDAENVLAACRQELAVAQLRVAEQEQRRRNFERTHDTIRAAYIQYGFRASPDDPVAARRDVLLEQERVTRLERALFVLDASNAVDRLASLEGRASTLRQRLEVEAAKLADAERATEAARQIDAGSREVANQMLTEQFDTVMPLLQELYRRLRPHTEWTEIRSDFGGRVRASLNFTVGDGHNLQFLFSSGQRRAAGLAFLLAIHLSRRWCKWHSLLLDDPVQHIDDYRALNLVEVLAAIRRDKRQVIVAVEDTALADLLCRRLRSTVGDTGRRFELDTSKTGASEIKAVHDIYPMPREVLRAAQAS